MSNTVTKHPRSEQLYERATKVIPGGVNSPVRAFKAVGGTPLFVQRGEGQFLIDADGRKYLDLVNSWGALILGHAEHCFGSLRGIHSSSGWGWRATSCASSRSRARRRE